ncbi:MAG: CDP-alcohol phosphatidyltransferase family protein [Deltaproteobacteria bacterium]|nr:CDP-alcohol phosphatidyltransferase family protein [Deltaproteobacteria bacterium]
MERFTLLVPALLMLATMLAAFVVYCGLCWSGRPPVVRGLKHNQLLGPFMARYVIWVLGPIERALVGRVSPNMITALSLLVCAATGVAAGLGHLGTAAWLYAVGGILDILDGRLARLTNHQTKSGALFDSVSDRWAELFVFSGYAWYLRETPWLLAVMAAVAGSMMVSYTRARAEGLAVELSGGVMQRAERVLLTSAGTLLAAWYGASATHAELVIPILGGVMTAVGVASTCTALNRWLVAYRALARLESVAPTDVPKRQPAAAPALPPEYVSVTVPAKLRESAELAPAVPRL